MANRPKLAPAILVLGAALAFSLFGVVSSSASEKAKGRVSAHLTKTSFTAAEAKTVKLVCKFSPASKRFNYQLSQKSGGKWLLVRRVNKTGSFKGSSALTVKKLFGSKPLRVGQYRVRVSADANTVSRSFRIKAADPGGNHDGPDTSTAPKAGLWSNGKTGSGRVQFYVDLSGKNVSHIGYWYHYSTGDPGAACSGDSAVGTPSSGSFSVLPISNDFFLVSFLIPPSNSSFAANGTFTSATTAYGSVSFFWKSTLCPSGWTSGSVHWTATWQSSAQP